MSEPLVSIVLPTYNRSNILKYAIGTVLWQTVEDWELIVVGDACTDDTAEVVASFGDPRIRFFNREENWGEQSAPNNDGLALARGKFLAFQNHDDLWLPNHLRVLTDALNADEYDIVYSLFLNLRPDGRLLVSNVTGAAGYAGDVFVPASTWCMQRETVRTVGPWRPYTESFTTPSQDWLHRAFKARCRIGNVRRVTAVVIPSVARPGCYRNRDVAEHETFFRAMQQPEFLENALTSAITSRQGLWWHLKGGVKAIVNRLARALGIPAVELRGFLRFRRKGRAVDMARARYGLPSLRRRE